MAKNVRFLDFSFDISFQMQCEKNMRQIPNTQYKKYTYKHNYMLPMFQVQCEKDLMRVRVVFDRPFYGMVFSKGFYRL